MIITPSIPPSTVPVRVVGGGGQQPIMLVTKGRVHSQYVSSLSQSEHKKKDNHGHVYRQYESFHFT